MGVTLPKYTIKSYLLYLYELFFIKKFKFHKFVARVIKMINFITISILDFGVTSHNVIDQSMIINFEMKKISGGEAKQNPRDST